MQTNTYERTASNWLKKDDKTLASGIKDGLDIFEIGFSLERDPVSVLKLICLNNIYECIPGSEEEQEFFGLAFSGVPISETILWCTVSEFRTKEIDSLMTFGDMRPMVYFAYEHGINFYSVNSFEDMVWVMEQPASLLPLAIVSIDHEYDVLTPSTLRDHMSRAKMTTKDLPLHLCAGNKAGSYLRKASSKGARKSKKSYTKGAKPTRRGVKRTGRAAWGKMRA